MIGVIHISSLEPDIGDCKKFHLGVKDSKPLATAVMHQFLSGRIAVNIILLTFAVSGE